MAKLVWDELGHRYYETGVDQGVLYMPDSKGEYVDGVAWNGLTAVTESPSGAEPNAQYADNIKYLNLYSAEEFAATVEAFTYPDEFNQYDGLAVPVPGVAIGQQPRKMFGLSYRSRYGNDIEGESYGYKLHLLYGCTASPSEKAYQTINDSPAAIAFSWSVATNPVAVTGMRPTSLLTVNSSDVPAADLSALEQILYGGEGVNPMLPHPDDVITLFQSGVQIVVPQQPGFDGATNTLTIPVVAGLKYYIGSEEAPPGDTVLTVNTLVTCRPEPGYVIESGTDTDWYFTIT
jgi:hypothetical protein